jgi:anti-sigma factor RsiW
MSGTTCTSIDRDDLFTGYVRDSLSPEDRDAFEEHFFTCEACFEKLQILQALQAQLRSRPAEAPSARMMPARWWRWALVPAAAGLLLAAAVALWPTGPPPATPIPRPDSPAQRQPAPVAPGPTVPAAKPPAPPREVTLAVLARVEPPLYVPLSLRGPRDKASDLFQAAMRKYENGDYAGAVPDLSAASRLSANLPHVSFFLAICHLLTDQIDVAVEGLQATIALGNSPYLEEAHYYLAKARLRQGDLTAARTELRLTIERRGQLEAEARRLLAQVEALLRER